MKKFRKVFFAVTTLSDMLLIFSNQVFASVITQDEVQAAVDATGKEQVTGNILVWFLCAIAFLKVSQKIDSYLASLGINVGHTGGSMLGDAMVVMKGLSMIKSGGNLLGGKFGGGGSGNSGPSSGGGFLSGGLTGAIGRQISNSATASATGQGGNPITGKMFDSSLSSGGKFANDIIGKIAKGDISKTGSITGDKAASALTSYLGGSTDSSPAFGLAETSGGSAGHGLSVPSVSGGSADISEVQGSAGGSPEIGPAPFDESISDVSLTGDEMLRPEIGSAALAEDGSDEGHQHVPQNPEFDENPINNADYTTSSATDGGVEIPASIPMATETSEKSSLPEGQSELPGFEPVSDSLEGSSPIGTAPFIEHQEGAALCIGSDMTGSSETATPAIPADSSVNSTPSLSGSGSEVNIGAAPFVESHTPATDTSGGVSEYGSGEGVSIGEPSFTPITGSSVSGGEATFDADTGSGVTVDSTPHSSGSGVTVDSAHVSGPGITVDSAPQISGSGVTVDSAPQVSGPGVTIDSTPQISSSGSAVFLGNSHTTEGVDCGSGSGNAQPVFSNVEIGGGRIMGTETTPTNPGGIKFGMYAMDQYAEPSGDYSIVNTIDGSKWYKQYAIDTVRKTPYKNESNKIVYKEEIVKALPQVPKRKDKM